MKVKDIPVYYLNPDFFSDRRKRMDEYLSSIGMNYERIPSNSKASLRQIRINEGFIKLAERAIENNIFPCLELEDDARLISSLPEEIFIPEGIKFIYWGISLWECGGIKPKLSISNWDENYYRVKYSLGCHAILIPNENSARHFIELQELAIQKGDYSDIYCALDSEKEIYLTPKDGPYFYQQDAHTEPITKFSWTNISGTVKMNS